MSLSVRVRVRVWLRNNQLRLLLLGLGYETAVGASIYCASLDEAVRVATAVAGPGAVHEAVEGEDAYWACLADQLAECSPEACIYDE